jgi:hypothetical protein
MNSHSIHRDLDSSNDSRVQTGDRARFLKFFHDDRFSDTERLKKSGRSDARISVKFQRPVTLRWLHNLFNDHPSLSSSEHDYRSWMLSIKFLVVFTRIVFHGSWKCAEPSAIERVKRREPI